MEIDFQPTGDVLVVIPRGRVDTLSAPSFEKQARKALQRKEQKWIFDLSALTYISSAGLRVLIGTAKTLKANGGELRLAAADGAVKKVFQISGFFSLLKYFDTRDAALENF